MRLASASYSNAVKAVRRLIILALLAGMAYGFLSATGLLLFAGEEESIITGVSLPGQPLGGLTADAARRVVQKWVQQRNSHIIHVHGLAHSSEQIWPISSNIMPTLDVERIVQEALAVGKQGKLPHRWRVRWQALTKGVVLLQNQMPNATLIRWLENLIPFLYQPAHNAYLDLETEQIINEQLGHRLNVTASAYHIQTSFLALTNDVELVMQPIEPQVDASMVEKTQASVRLSRFSTHFNPQLANRVANIRLAATALDGVILPPGAVFSYNQTVGAREKANGYLEAPELVGGDLVDGVGGGVCQVSSTLYNAVLLADLNVLERYKHSTATGYIAAGRDATVSYGHMDFRFRNSLEYPVVIRTFVTEDQLTISIYGKHKLPYEVVLLSETKELPMPVHMETDPQLPPDEQLVVQEGRPGKVVIINKELRYANGTVRHYAISHNLYEAKPQLVKVGVPLLAPDI